MTWPARLLYPLTKGLLNAGLIFVLTAMSPGCRSDSEISKTTAPSAVTPPSTNPDEIHLNLEQRSINQISTAVAQEELVGSSITAIGRVRARAGGEAQVFAPFAGRLLADPAKLPRVGTHVERGEVLAEVEQFFSASERLQFAATITQLRAAIQQAQHDITFRQAELDRVKQLYDAGALALKRLQAAELDLMQAQTQLDAARRAQSQYEQASAPDAVPRRESILAPLSGTVLIADLAVGQQTDPSRSLLTIVDLSSVWVEAAIQESELNPIHKAETARIHTRANPGRSYLGKLISIGNLVDPANRTIAATFAVENRDEDLKIGMYAEAEIPTAGRIKTLTIPSMAVIFEESRSLVFVETQPGVFVRRFVAPGARFGDKIVITSGLNPGEKVVSRGAQSLYGEVSKRMIPVEKDQR